MRVKHDLKLFNSIAVPKNDAEKIDWKLDVKIYSATALHLLLVASCSTGGAAPAKQGAI
jgi:hypothetical protein